MRDVYALFRDITEGENLQGLINLWTELSIVNYLIFEEIKKNAR